MASLGKIELLDEARPSTATLWPGEAQTITNIAPDNFENTTVIFSNLILELKAQRVVDILLECGKGDIRGRGNTLTLAVLIFPMRKQYS